MKPISSLFSKQFLSDIRDRGEIYFFQRRVLIREKKPGFISCLVVGTDQYFVNVTEQSSQYGPLLFECTCPYFQSGDLCKHVWAVLLEIENENLGSLFQLDIASKNSPQMPEWKRRFEMAKSLTKNSIPKESSAAATRIKQKQGTYVLDVEGAEVRGQLCLSLYTQERLKKGGWGKHRPAMISSSEIADFEDPREREFLWEIVGRAQPLFGYLFGRETSPTGMNEIQLVAEQIESLLRKI